MLPDSSQCHPPEACGPFDAVVRLAGAAQDSSHVSARHLHVCAMMLQNLQLQCTGSDSTTGTGTVPQKVLLASWRRALHAHHSLAEAHLSVPCKLLCATPCWHYYMGVPSAVTRWLSGHSAISFARSLQCVIRVQPHSANTPIATTNGTRVWALAMCRMYLRTHPLPQPTTSGGSFQWWWHFNQSLNTPSRYCQTVHSIFTS